MQVESSWSVIVIGWTDHKTHGPDHIMFFESQIGSFFWVGKKKNIGVQM